MASNGTPPEKTASGPSQFRERISHWLYLRQEILLSLLWGVLSAGLIAVFAQHFKVSDRGGLGEFYLVFCIAVLVLSFIKWRISLLVLTAALVVLGLICRPELGYTVGAGMAVVLLWSLFGRYEILLILAAPLLAGRCPILFPILAGFLLGKKNGSIWAAFAFLAGLACVVFRGDATDRFGINMSVALLERMREAPVLDETKSAVERYLTGLDFDPIKISYATMGETYPVRIAAQFILWIAATVTTASVYMRKRYTDRLAEEYIRRAQADTTPEAGSKYRSMPAAIVFGSLVFIMGNIVLKVVLPAEGEVVKISYAYSLDQTIFIDLPAVVAVILALTLRFTGDPSFTLTTEAQTKARKGRRPQESAPVPRKSAIFTATTAVSPEVSSLRERTVTSSSTGPRVDLGRPKSAALGTSEWRPETTQPEPESVPQAAFKLHEKIDDQYTIDKIQSGGMGVVYIVTDDFSGKRYAVKSLKDELLNNRESAERFGIEAKTWINLDHHPNIVQAMLYRVVKGRPLLFLEYIEGTDLEHVLQMSRSYSIQQIIDWAKQICRGMAYSHSKKFPGGRVGLIHRDLKPANLMLTREGVVKITDFGLAKLSDTVTGLTRESSGLGTLMYMPPEQLESAKDVDRRADIYAFGAVVHEILTGEPPFTADTMSSLCLKILSEAPNPPSRVRPDCPPDLDRIVLKCLEKDKEHRYSDFADIEHELEAIVPTSSQYIAPPVVAKKAPPLPPSRSRITSAGKGLSSARVSRGSTPGGTSTDSGTTAIEGILFLDMVASTARGTKYGDNLIMQLKEELAQIVETESTRFSVAFTKGMGDGYMMTFPDAEAAVRAGSNIMRRVSARNQTNPPFRKIDLRMGIHFGEVFLDSAGDRQGSSVNMASRLQSVDSTHFHQTQTGIQLDQLSDENRIFISEVVNDEISGHKQFKTRLVGFFDLKGFTGRHRVFEIIWK